MIDIFGMAGLSVNRQLQCNCLKHEDDPDFLAISDLHLAIFLNGFILNNRERKEGALPVPENN